MVRSVVLARLRSQFLMSRKNAPIHIQAIRKLSTGGTASPVDTVLVSQNKAPEMTTSGTKDFDAPKNTEKVLTSACGDIDDDDDDDEMEQEEMFVEAHASFGHGQQEWGGPRRGGRLLEPTRFGDWERKGRCSDF